MSRLSVTVGTFASFALTFFVGCSAAHGPGASSIPGTSILNNSNSNTTTVHGTVDSGGGRAVVCRTTAGAITSVRSLDLYEADHTSRLQASASVGTLEEEWQRFAYRMSLRYSDPMDRAASIKRLATLKDQFMAQVRFVSLTEARLKMVDDSKEDFTVQGCGFEQLANWQDDETILVQKELWDVMPARDQAALIAHEYIYDAYRSFGHRTSMYPRRVVGLAFSTHLLRPIAPQGDASFSCISQTPVSPDNLFALNPGRIDLAISQTGALSLNFLSYPTQILLEPLTLPILTSDEGAAIARAINECRKEDRAKAKLRSGSDLTILTSYFKDHLHADLTVACGADRANSTPGPEVTLTLKSTKVGVMSNYSCHALGQ